MLEQAVFGLLVLLTAGIGAVIFLLLKNAADGNKAGNPALMERLTVLGEQNRELRRLLDEKLSETHRVSSDQFSRAAGLMHTANQETQKTMTQMHQQSQKIITEVTEKLAKLDETNRQVVNFSSQLQNLQDILKNPKQRGVLGEYYLEETLKNVLPPNSYRMQYAFKNGEIVDAVVLVGDKIIPVDSKFSLETYERILACRDAGEREKLEKQFRQDLKNRIDETAKYVRPREKTMDFAFMFIPSEAIYYDLLINKVGAVKTNTRDLIEYAFREKKVIIVSPTSFLAYLQTVLQGLRALRIEEKAQQIRQGIEGLRRHILSYEDFFKKVGTSLGSTVNHYNQAYKQFKLIDKDVSKVIGAEAVIEPEFLEKPKQEDDEDL